MVEAVDDAPGRRRRGQRARDEVVDRYTWRQIGLDLVAVAGDCATAAALSGA
jgi:hypothetical protein